MVSNAEALTLINLARTSISDFFTNKESVISEDIKEQFKDRQRVFVAIYLDGQMRGCKGYAETILPLWEAVMKVSQGAAFEDQRFSPLNIEEFKRIEIELSLLTEPSEIDVSDPSEYPSKILLGRDGLMIKDELGGYGVLLPQIALEWGWDEKKFLSETCNIAGEDSDCWNNMRRNVYSFQTQIFREKDGRVEELKHPNSHI